MDNPTRPEAEIDGSEEKQGQDEDGEEAEEAEDGEEEEPSETYVKRMQNALDELKRRSDEILSPEGLRTYSPKFLKILENLKNKAHEGLHLVYSQFRSMEGIGILKLVLEANGFAEFRVKKSSTGEWDLIENEGDARKPRFVLHTGTETDEEKKMVLNIYNSKWKEVPQSILSKIQHGDNPVENNFRGEVIQVLMITSSGAEGINLKNTRYVHIVEPYWHMVRLEQVIGRARRICSHQDLPEELRTVQVFLYIATLTEQQSTSDNHIELRLRDVSKLSAKMSDTVDNTSALGRYIRTLDGKKSSVVTTDQMLFENALVKDRVNSQILTAVKETAMDCKLYSSNANKDDNLVCYGFGKVQSNAFGSYPTLQEDLAEKDVDETRNVKVALVKITDPETGKEYALNKKTKELFRYEQYNRAKMSGEDLVPVGRLALDKYGREAVQLNV